MRACLLALGLLLFEVAGEVAGLAVANALAASAPVAADYGRLPDIRQAKLNPAGDKLMMLRAINDTYHVTVTDLETRSSGLIMAADVSQFLFNWCHWANDSRIVCSIKRNGELRSPLFFYSDNRVVFTRLIAVNADGSGVQQLIPSAVSRPGRDLQWNPPVQDNVVSWLRDDPEHILVQIAREKRTRPTLYRLNIYTNRLKRVRKAHDAVLQWSVDRNGKLRHAFGIRDSEYVAFAIRDRRLNALDLTHLGGVQPPSLIGYAEDQNNVLVEANNGNDTRGVYEVHGETGKIVRTLAEDADYDVSGWLLQNAKNGRVGAVRYWQDDLTTRWFDEHHKALHDALRQQLPGQPTRVTFPSANDSYDRWIARASGNGTVPQWYLVNLDPASRRVTGAVALGRDFHADTRVREWRSIRYATRDNVDITGYLLEPDGRGPHPTIILPHGGPYLRDVPTFDYWAQFMADRGYAVLKPNFRGSFGFGDAFLSAGFSQWGERMQNDVLDGLDWLIAQGVADADRACIVGGSYGGYVALVAAYKTPEKFRCAVSFAGVADLQEVVARLWAYEFGQISRARIQRGDAMRANSPHHNAATIQLPLLLVHGDLDRRVVVEQSRKFAAELKKLGKPHTYIEQANGDHFLSRQSHRQAFMTAMEGFLAQHLSP